MAAYHKVEVSLNKQSIVVGAPSPQSVTVVVPRIGPKGDQGDVGPTGSTGATGATGAPGADGREVELQTTATHIQWRYEGETEWTNLVALSAITGPQGIQGEVGNTGATGAAGTDGREVELQKTATHVQWRYEGEVAWTNLIPLADITGPQGPAGTQTTDASLLTSGTLADARLSSNVPLKDAANTFTQNQTFSGTNSVAPNQTSASGSSIMTRDLVDARCGRVLFYQVSSALSANSTAKVFDSTTLTIPAGTYEVQAHGRAIYNGSNGGWSFGVERASGNSGTATALIFQHIGESSTFNNTGGAYRSSPTLNLFGGNAILAAAATGATSLHRTGQAAASGLLVVTSELVVVWYVAQVATDASNATTLDANSFLMLTKVA